MFEDHFYDDWPEYRQYLDHGCNYEEPDGALDTINPRIEAVESFVHVVLKTTERDLELVPCDQAVSVFEFGWLFPENQSDTAWRVMFKIRETSLRRPRSTSHHCRSSSMRFSVFGRMCQIMYAAS